MTDSTRRSLIVAVALAGSIVHACGGPTEPPVLEGPVRRSELIGRWEADRLWFVAVPEEDTTDLLAWDGRLQLTLNKDTGLAGTLILPEGSPPDHPADTTEFTGVWTFDPVTQTTRFVTTPKTFLADMVVDARRLDAGAVRMTGELLLLAVPLMHSTVDARIEIGLAPD